MNLTAWERLCRNERCLPIGSAETPVGTIYIAEGKRPAKLTAQHPTERRPHIFLLWALFTDKGQIARSMSFPLTLAMHQKRRVAYAVENAAVFASQMTATRKRGVLVH